MEDYMIRNKEDAIDLKNRCVAWIQDYFKINKVSKAVIGISGGKDSTVVAYLCVEALGKENVIGVLMPNGNQSDINDSYEVVNNLGIKYVKHNIADAYNDFWHIEGVIPSEQAKINLAPRLRMTTLYFVAQSVGGRVVGTGNLCERILGYYTLWGDGACDLNPIANMLVSDVIAVGEALGVPGHLLHKAPADGLSGLTDEEKLGFSYEDAEKVIRHRCEDVPDNIRKTIERRIDSVLWKWHLQPDIPKFNDYKYLLSFS